jgi:hypothetical protein
MQSGTENTERKRAEDALRRNESYLSEAQGLSYTGSLSWRVSTGEIFWSEETFRIFQYDRNAGLKDGIPLGFKLGLTRAAVALKDGGL